MQRIKNDDKVHQPRQRAKQRAHFIWLVQRDRAILRFRRQGLEEVLIDEIHDKRKRAAQHLREEPQTILHAVNAIDAADEHAAGEQEQHAEHDQPAALSLAQHDVTQPRPHPGQHAGNRIEFAIGMMHDGQRRINRVVRLSEPPSPRRGLVQDQLQIKSKLASAQLTSENMAVYRGALQTQARPTIAYVTKPYVR
jgi:hypothetical protein